MEVSLSLCSKAIAQRAAGRRGGPSQQALKHLLTEVETCRTCAAVLPHGPRPVVRAHSAARILIAGQAPGLRVHETGIPWNDPSGDRLRQWLGVDRERFYDPRWFALVPMGFCYPGRGRSGDLPPRSECSEQWLGRILAQLPHRQLTLLVGQYSQRYYLAERRKKSATETIAAWRQYLPDYLPLPHPSGRNNGWLKRNGWFEAELVPQLQKRCAAILELAS
jgi:uracil-DNA glycosylase